MRFIIREYLSSLKEDGELDSFLAELLRSMHCIPLTKTQRGRQDGVDLPAVGTDSDGVRKVFLLVIKKGNFSRKAWASGEVTDILPSLESLRITYVNTRIAAPFNQLKKKVIVCCNGYLEQAVDRDWAQYITLYGSDQLEFEFWGIDKLVDLAIQYQMDEAILPEATALSFRRALAFIDLPDYDLAHFNQFLAKALEVEDGTKVALKEARKRLRLLNLCLSIVRNWCDNSGNLKPAYIAGERVLLTTWDWILRHQLLDVKGVVDEYMRIVYNWDELGKHYLIRIGPYLQVPHGLGLGVIDHDEYCLLTYEQIGIISTIGLFQVWDAAMIASIGNEEALVTAKEAAEFAIAMASMLINLIQENNSAASSPRFDEHCIEINLGLTLLYKTHRREEAAQWIGQLINSLQLNWQIAKFFPLFYTDVEKLATKKGNEPKSSILLVILAEWCVLLRLENEYNILREFIAEHLPDVDLQLWFPDKVVDQFLFICSASKESGSTLINISLPGSLAALADIMDQERSMLKTDEESSVVRGGVGFLAYLACRHFRSYPFPNLWRRLLTITTQ